MSDNKKENLFAKLAQQNARAVQEQAEPTELPPPEVAPPSPAPVVAVKEKKAPAKQAEPAHGKRSNPNYCQANAYIPKSIRKQVDRALFDIDGLDYSSLVEELLTKWLKSRRVAD